MQPSTVFTLIKSGANDTRLLQNTHLCTHQTGLVWLHILPVCVRDIGLPEFINHSWIPVHPILLSNEVNCSVYNTISREYWTDIAMLHRDWLGGFRAMTPATWLAEGVYFFSTLLVYIPSTQSFCTLRCCTYMNKNSGCTWSLPHSLWAQDLLLCTCVCTSVTKIGPSDWVWMDSHPQLNSDTW